MDSLRRNHGPQEKDSINSLACLFLQNLWKLAIVLVIYVTPSHRAACALWPRYWSDQRLQRAIYPLFYRPRRVSRVQGRSLCALRDFRSVPGEGIWLFPEA